MGFMVHRFLSRSEVCFIGISFKWVKMVSMFGKFPCSRPSHRPKHQYFLVEGVGGKRISPAAALHGVPPLEAFEPVEHPAEPKEIDKPVQCPPQENSIMQDGLIWRERVARSFRRQVERISKWQEGDAAGHSQITGKSGRQEKIDLGEKSLFMTRSAPAHAVTQTLD